MEQRKVTRKKNEPNELEKIYSFAEAAQYLHVSTKTLHRYVDDNLFEGLIITLTGNKERRRITFPSHSLKTFVRKRANGESLEERQNRMYVQRTKRAHHRKRAQERYKRHYPNSVGFCIAPDNGNGQCCICNQESIESICFICNEKFRGEIQRLRAQLWRARQAGTPATLTISEWLVTLDHFHWKCAYCQIADHEVMEHYIPITLGGGTTFDNCIPACIKCNTSKSDIHPERDIS